MKIYRNSYYTHQDSSVGFEFFTSKADSERAMKEHLKSGEDDGRSCIDNYDIEISKDGIMSILNKVATQPQNG